MAQYSGWKRTAIWLTGLVATLTIFLVVMLFVSLFALEKNSDENTVTTSGDYGSGDALGQSILYKGNCDVSARANLWIHLAINIIGTGVLASSNFFMQSLVAPTRKEVDAAHKAGHWLEIGVQSLKNVRFIGWRKILFWSLFSLSSVPLHLVFNGCVLESKGTNGFTVLLGAESLASASWQGRPSITGALLEQYSNGHPIRYEDEDPSRLKPINGSIATNDTHGSWQKISFQECMKRYNDPEKSLTHWRHLIMVMYNYEDEWRNSTKGWKLNQVYKNITGMNDTDIINPLWTVTGFTRSGQSNGMLSGQSNGMLSGQSNEMPSGPISGKYEASYNWDEDKNVWRAGEWSMLQASNTLDPSSGLLVMDYKLYKPEYRVMQVDHCWSEKYEAPCRLSIANSLLLIVCIMCGIKSILCFLVLKFRVWGDENPLMTPGDAIASFISRPDEETRGMCTLSLEDLKKLPAKTQLGLGDSTQAYKWLQGP
ncbi:unnamed protein product [Fusarium equiseti]|uniref:DUF6536 domain-containing protein n=1 Tax=Fusarium equiseti TaxID=61235 RepID=A0A8J2NNB9_FUSEQ|nr:unnamed protein product [Fusarium equiseti]